MDHPFPVGANVLWHGTKGVIEQVAYSRSTEYHLYTVAVDQRIRVRVPANHVELAARP